MRARGSYETGPRALPTLVTSIIAAITFKELLQGSLLAKLHNYVHPTVRSLSRVCSEKAHEILVLQVRHYFELTEQSNVNGFRTIPLRNFDRHGDTASFSGAQRTSVHVSKFARAKTMVGVNREFMAAYFEISVKRSGFNAGQLQAARSPTL